ncbi:DNA/RNA non-specific endonuclease [Hymenobacter latericus]|uniref:DNA/RNA non-specific endonuclease n=1 Tax=Hymenobacter sp. YIM 151858-1 TaxID=2987688 RepID=UPI0022274D91|nr:DNA/RNA non-specific endonuclease [Hymenobacter sp. YIM 151858-1]UYZ61162.1 DNA/RNA non-specific endonuclease [Hymenobacter sp. YIM 151858-1]
MQHLYPFTWRLLLLAWLALGSGVVAAQNVTEEFEAAGKADYPTGAVALSSGSWTLDDALLGTAADDRKAGLQAVRLVRRGTLTMDFFLPGGAGTVTVQHAAYGSDASSAFELWYQTQGCADWVRVGAPVVASAYSLQTASFPVNVPGSVRLQLRKVTGAAARLNLDNFAVTPFSATAPPPPVAGDDQHLTMGNPSGAVADVSQPTNYLMEKAQFALSYHRDRGTPNWVSWYLAPKWLGSTKRQDDFRADPALPAGWYQVQNTSYSGTGFDRGHNTPSADRTSTVADNSATFLMTNMIPQSPDNNQKTWNELEGYSRTLVSQGNELYVIMGSYGIGGEGEIRTTTPFRQVYAETIDQGRVTVPKRIWKVIVVLPQGTNDLSRVGGAGTRIIAVDTPNANGMTTNWGQYRTSVDAIEAATGLDLLSALPLSVQQVVEAQVDNGPTN